ncbi:hypothetical protein CWIS_12910 [Cellulomonas sp. A375-1]|nr:hypothetical protein CWIS_12910 [Cellulomonas sp. A375-1]
MSTAYEFAAAVASRSDPRSLAVSLGVAHATPPSLRLPPLAQKPVPGHSPLEATGWAVPDEPTELGAVRSR